MRSDLDTVKDEFISTVSHELRTPLTSIRGALGLLSAGLLGNDRSQGAEPAAHRLQQYGAADPADQRHSGSGAHGVRAGAAEAAALLHARPGARGDRHHVRRWRTAAGIRIDLVSDMRRASRSTSTPIRTAFCRC